MSGISTYAQGVQIPSRCWGHVGVARRVIREGAALASPRVLLEPCWEHWELPGKGQTRPCFGFLQR